MNRPLTVALTFGSCLLVLLAALAWTSINLVRLDTAEREAQRQASLEENVRLALWRMDSALAGIVAQESVRPSADYRALAPIEQNPPTGSSAASGDLKSPPRSAIGSTYVIAHLQIAPDGRLISHHWRNVPVEPSKPPSPESSRQLDELAQWAFSERLADRLPPPAATEMAGAPQLATESTPSAPVASLSQGARGTREFNRRAQFVQSNNVLTQNALQVETPTSAPVDMAGGIVTPVWLNGRLLLARRANVRGEECLQICWLDWPVIQSWLSDIVSDLLPDARLAPAPLDLDEPPTRRLAALPLVLEPGSVPESQPPRWSPLRWSLFIAWVCVLLAALAVAFLLSGVISLSERRAAFVSAVTHELRTPLTTFRMYAEMLAENMVTDESQRRAYLDTLRSEAERLSHLVENVLAYARLERSRSAGARETVSVGDLIERMQERLALRCRQAEIQLTMEAADDVRQRQVVTDVASVEQIVFNLVDNACKYAGGSTDRRVRILVGAEGGSFVLRVTDHGPGIPPSVARHLFQPFSKSAEDAARSAPGIGLGLALSRRLARQLGGTLKLERTGNEGACFVLTLPGLKALTGNGDRRSYTARGFE